MLFAFVLLIIIFLSIEKEEAFWWLIGGHLTNIIVYFFIISDFLCGFYVSFPIWVLPIDLIIGKKRTTAVFNGAVVRKIGGFGKGRYSVIFRFQLGNKRMKLTVPFTITGKEIELLEFLDVGTLVNISYYKLSHVILSWELA